MDLIVGQGNVNFPALGKIAIQFGVTVCVTSICQWLMNMVNNRITFQVVRDIRVQAFQHMEILPLSYMPTSPATPSAASTPMWSSSVTAC